MAVIARIGFHWNPLPPLLSAIDAFVCRMPTLGVPYDLCLISYTVTQPRATGEDELDIISHKNYLDCFQNLFFAVIHLRLLLLTDIHIGSDRR